MREDAVFGLRNRKGRGGRFRRLSSLDESRLGEEESIALTNGLDNRQLSASYSLPGKPLDSPTEDKESELVKDGILRGMPNSNSLPRDLDSLASRKSKYFYSQV